MSSIPLYTEINQLHKLTGSSLRTQDPLFHCFDMAGANDLTVQEVPPHRVDFYTLAVNFETEYLDYTLNQTTFRQPRNFVLCVAPGQVATWQKHGNWFGYCTFFKSEFLHIGGPVGFLRQYPFFNINETNLLPISSENFAELQTYFRQILKEQATGPAFSREVIRSVFQAVLWQVRRLYETDRINTPALKAGAVITAHFQHLVNELFATTITIEEYAELLNITPNHLSQTVKSTTGRTAKQIIAQRRLDEAKYLLTYTRNSPAEVAFYLRFSEPTHFTRFFRQHTGQTPLSYRTHQQAGFTSQSPADPQRNAP